METSPRVGKRLRQRLFFVLTGLSHNFFQMFIYAERDLLRPIVAFNWVKISLAGRIFSAPAQPSLNFANRTGEDFDYISGRLLSITPSAGQTKQKDALQFVVREVARVKTSWQASNSSFIPREENQDARFLRRVQCLHGQKSPLFPRGEAVNRQLTATLRELFKGTGQKISLKYDDKSGRGISLNGTFLAVKTL